MRQIACTLLAEWHAVDQLNLRAPNNGRTNSSEHYKLGLWEGENPLRRKNPGCRIYVNKKHEDPPPKASEAERASRQPPVVTSVINAHGNFGGVVINQKATKSEA